MAVFSLEMPVEQLMLRMMCSEAQVNMQNLRHDVLTDDELERLGDTLLPLSNAEIYMDATSGITVTEMRSRCRRLQIEHGLDMVMIDYIGLMSAGSGNPNRSRQEEVAAISRAIKGLAQELRVPIITLSQLSRAPQGRANHRPVLSDLRELRRDRAGCGRGHVHTSRGYYYPEYEDKTATEIIVAKQRNGQLDTVMVTFLGEYVKFVNSLNPKRAAASTAAAARHVTCALKVCARFYMRAAISFRKDVGLCQAMALPWPPQRCGSLRRQSRADSKAENCIRRYRRRGYAVHAAI